MKLLTLDTETRDDFLGLKDIKIGSGWTFKYNNLCDEEFKLLGTALIAHTGEEIYTQDLDRVRHEIDRHDAIIMHNSQYDLGVLLASGIEIKDKDIYDTLILARLYNTNLRDYSLDNLSRIYLKQRKDYAMHIEAVNRELYPLLKREEKAKERCLKDGTIWKRELPDLKKLDTWVKSNMELMSTEIPEAVEEYAKKDTRLTLGLFNTFMKDVTCQKVGLKFSLYNYPCLEYRKNGVRIDLEKLQEVRDSFSPLVAEASMDLYEKAGEEFDVNSPKQTTQILLKNGVQLPKTDTGRYSAKEEVLKKLNNPIANAILEARKLIKLDGVLKTYNDMQFYTTTHRGTEKYGRLFFNISVLGASATGRMSSSDINIQQIPKRGEKAGFIRDIFIPEEGKKWYSLDFKSQEIRMQAHYAVRLKCKGSDRIKKLYTENPYFDSHQDVSDLCGITRDYAKEVNLGLTYGMGIRTLANKLNCTIEHAKDILNKYYHGAPHLKDLVDKITEAMKHKKFVFTYSRRRSYLRPRQGNKSYEYQATNKVIQGSSADQTYEAMWQSYKLGLPVLFPVHDELNLSGTYKQAVMLKNIMENCIPLEIPMISDIEEGESWGSCEKVVDTEIEVC